MRSVTNKYNKRLRQRLAVVFAADFLDKADNGTPQFSVAESRRGQTLVCHPRLPLGRRVPVPLQAAV